MTDACACDSGGDCDCFCTAVAAYAQACSEVGVCVAWRSPSICRKFYVINTSENVAKCAVTYISALISHYVDFSRLSYLFFFFSWTRPTFCFSSALFCDYYNQQGECEWHYKPCGASCMKTCKNPSGKCLNDLPGLEGKNSCKYLLVGTYYCIFNCL